MRIEKVSVLVPVFNREDTLYSLLLDGAPKKSIFSIKEVRLLMLEHFGIKDFNILIINDGSTDQSQEIIEKIATDNPCIEFIKKEKKRGGF